MPGRQADRYRFSACRRPASWLILSAGMALAGGSAAANAPPLVPVTLAVAMHYRATVEVSGQIAAVQSASIAAQRAGVVKAMLFHSGETVAKGAVLLRLDDGVERAQVRLDQAKLDEAGRTLARDRRLRAISGISQAQLETDQASDAEAAAQLSLDVAREDRRVIRAPFGGILGIRHVSAGDYIAQGGQVVTITQTNPLRVLFAVPETELAGVGFGDAFSFTLPAAGAAVATGRILALSPELNPTTRARMVEGRIDNSDASLLPGAFGTVSIATGTPVAAFRVPATAIDYGPVGSFVYAVDRRGGAAVVRAVYVKILSTAGATAIVAAPQREALHRIVAMGGFKLVDGETITPEQTGGGS